MLNEVDVVKGKAQYARYDVFLPHNTECVSPLLNRSLIQRRFNRVRAVTCIYS